MSPIALAPPPTGLRRVRHVKRGTTYTVLGDAAMQIGSTGAMFRDYDKLVIYQGEDGRLWARFPEEMWDGRFEPIADAPAPAAPPQVPEDVREALHNATPAPPADDGWDTAVGRAAEKERDEARAALEATEDETALANTDAAYERNRANAAEARLARARADALEEAALHCETVCLATGHDVACILADQLRALADREPAGRAALAAQEGKHG